MVGDIMDYRKRILEWFDLNSTPHMTSGAYAGLHKRLKKLEMLYPIQAIYFSLKDTESDLKWISKIDFKTPFAFMGYIFKIAEKYFQENAIRVDRENKNDNKKVDFDIDILEKDESRVVKRKVKDISQFL